MDLTPRKLIYHIFSKCSYKNKICQNKPLLGHCNPAQLPREQFSVCQEPSTVNYICLETSRKSISFITYLLKRLPSSYFHLQKSINNSSLPRMFFNKWAQKSLLQVEIPNQKHIILFAEIVASIIYILTN